MAPELIIAAEAQRPGWNREEARRQLMHAYPMLIVAEIDKLLGAIRDNYTGQRIQGGLPLSETS